jgi:hypothetical protein
MVLVVAAGLFPASGLGELTRMLREILSGTRQSGVIMCLLMISRLISNLALAS